MLLWPKNPSSWMIAVFASIMVNVHRTTTVIVVVAVAEADVVDVADAVDVVVPPNKDANTQVIFDNVSVGQP
jgi:hypothetical protein